jgi:hypothetical protein
VLSAELSAVQRRGASPVRLQRLVGQLTVLCESLAIESEHDLLHPIRSRGRWTKSPKTGFLENADRADIRPGDVRVEWPFHLVNHQNSATAAVAVFVVRDGRIASLDIYFDTAPYPR